MLAFRWLVFFLTAAALVHREKLDLVVSLVLMVFKDLWDLLDPLDLVVLPVLTEPKDLRDLPDPQDPLDLLA